TTGGRVSTTWQMASIEVIAGADTQASRHRARSATGRDAYLNQPRTTDAELANTGIFAEVQWQVNEAGRAVFGARADRAEVTDRRATTGGMMPMPNPTV